MHPPRATLPQPPFPSLTGGLDHTARQRGDVPEFALPQQPHVAPVQRPTEGIGAAVPEEGASGPRVVSRSGGEGEGERFLGEECIEVKSRLMELHAPSGQVSARRDRVATSRCSPKPVERRTRPVLGLIISTPMKETGAGNARAAFFFGGVSQEMVRYYNKSLC